MILAAFPVALVMVRVTGVVEQDKQLLEQPHEQESADAMEKVARNATSDNEKTRRRYFMVVGFSGWRFPAS